MSNVTSRRHGHLGGAVTASASAQRLPQGASPPFSPINFSSLHIRRSKGSSKHRRAAQSDISLYCYLPVFIPLFSSFSLPLCSNAWTLLYLSCVSTVFLNSITFVFLALLCKSDTSCFQSLHQICTLNFNQKGGCSCSPGIISGQVIMKSRKYSSFVLEI